MARILNIETATIKCSVATAEQGKLIAIEETTEGKDHARQLTLSIEAVLLQSGWTYAQLDAIAVSQGPGSYTGLRIGTATAKGLCFALNIPLLAISTLQAMAWELRQMGNGYLIPILPSRQGEVYLAVYDHELRTILPPQTTLLAQKPWQKEIDDQPIVSGGPGAKLYWDNTKTNRLTLIEKSILSSGNMIGLSYQSYQFKEEKNLIYFEPLYLKPVYISTKNK